MFGFVFEHFFFSFRDQAETYEHPFCISLPLDGLFPLVHLSAQKQNFMNLGVYRVSPFCLLWLKVSSLSSPGQQQPPSPEAELLQVVL